MYEHAHDERAHADDELYAADEEYENKAPNAPETVGDVVPLDIKLSQLPPLAGKKVAQARSHLFFVKEGNDAIVLVSPDDRRVADVIH